ncbi:CPBP family intramembrane glutamic endopeptidase [Lewinella sp. JB7]|uniref:CPBP family intramembrane glutamic endopeptidase n=1 Tax=Lewinella sp. JB7 TaxID=2962887 RepID=UPI0020C94FEC|nr:type II CAAX endopeptidase family protein [Lewinella sp. JB7]MCP9235694.1 CPBP family intramembrane metalloprotease [Lewinella sp. JB7]
MQLKSFLTLRQAVGGKLGTLNPRSGLFYHLAWVAAVCLLVEGASSAYAYTAGILLPAPSHVFFRAIGFQLICIGGVSMAWLLHDRSVRLRWSWQRFLMKKVVKYYAVMTVTTITIVAVFPVLLRGTNAVDNELLQASPGAAFISICVLAPLLEETLFRGLIQERLGRGSPWYVSILLSATLFALMHGTGACLFPLFMGGITLGYLYYRWNSLYACMLLHFVVNGSGYLINVL